jgi:MerR family transcriptional regulator/heat shock protein HspR
MSARYSEPLFVISVAARLVKMHPQTLRKYERAGLIEPSRTQGNLRLYSDSDIERLRQVKYLVEEQPGGRGLNLAGVQLALELTARLRQLRSSLDAEASASDNGATPARGGKACAEQLAQMRRELDSVLAMLGFVDQSEIRARFGDRASGD